MRNQAHTLMSLVMVAGVATAGFIGACGGKVVVDGSNQNGVGGAGGSAPVTSGPQASTGQVSTGVMTGPIMTGPATTGPDTTGAQMDVAVSVGPGPGSSVSVGPGSSAVSSSGGPGSSVSVGPGPASSSSGGTNACDTACNNASTCGFDFCGQFNINCDAPLPGQVQCPLTCIGNASCGDIQKLAAQNFATPLGACILGCQGMGAGVGSGPGSTGSGPPPASCQQCTLQACGGPIFACNSKKGPGSCSQWLQCAQGCGQDSMCLFGCDSQFPNAAKQYDGVYQCLCDKCDTSCPNENACLHLGP
jgi:hypothetical protein